MSDLLLHAETLPDVVTIPARTVLAYDGEGAPESATFQRAFPALYGAAYTLKFGRKASAKTQFKVGPLEGRWWAARAGTDFAEAPRDAWRWQLRVAIPDDVDGAELAAAVRAATTKKGGKLEGNADARKVFIKHIPEQRVGRALHIGPYGEEERTLRAIDRVLTTGGAQPAFSHVEIYLGNPRRTPPDRLRTILLRELR